MTHILKHSAHIYNMSEYKILRLGPNRSYTMCEYQYAH